MPETTVAKENPPEATTPSSPDAQPEVTPPESSPPSEDTSAAAVAAPIEPIPEIDWGDLNEGFEQDEVALAAEVPEPGVVPEPEVTAPVAPVPEVTPPQPEAPPPTAEPTPVVAPVAAVPAVAPTVAPEPVVPVAPVVAPEPAPAPFTQEDVTKWRDERVAHYSQIYSMTEDEGVEFVRAPEAVLPNLAARMIVDIEQHVYNTMSGVLPGIITRQFESILEERKTERGLLKAWDKLSDPANRAVYDRTLGAYRTANPNATPEQTIREVGASTYLALGLVPDAPVAPATPAPAEAVPFTPATPGGGTKPATEQKKSSNVFELIADEMDGDDRRTEE